MVQWEDSELWWEDSKSSVSGLFLLMKSLLSRWEVSVNGWIQEAGAKRSLNFMHGQKLIGDFIHENG